MNQSLKVACLMVAAVTLVGGAVWKYKSHRASLTLSSAHPVATAFSKPPAAQASLPMKTDRTLMAPASLPAGTKPSVAVSPTIPDRLRLAINQDGCVSFRALATPLSETERDALYRYLRTPAQDASNAEGENWLRNEMLDKLVQQSEPPRGFTDLLADLYHDKDQDEVLRDYAIQHMAPSYGRANVDERGKLQTAMWQATAETDSSIAGTTLLALLDIAQTEPTVNQSRLADTAFRRAEATPIKPVRR